MADEISVSMSLSVTNSNSLLQVSRSVSSIEVDMTGSGMIHGVQSVGTSKESLTIHGDIGTAGWCFLRNLDGSNYVDIGLDGDTPFMKLKAGECALFRLASTTISAKANSAAVDLEYWVLED